MLPTVHLVRHGETAWSLSGQHTSRTDIALTSRGEAQARQLGERLRGIEFSRIFTSPLQRARHTCELAGFADAMEKDTDLSEWHYGDYEGVTTIEIRKSFPDWNLFTHGCPGGESVQEITNRADRVVFKLRAMTGGILIFSHGHFLRVLAVRWIGWPAAEGRCLRLNTASISVLGWEHNDPDEPALAEWNTSLKDGSSCGDHLGSLGHNPPCK